MTNSFEPPEIPCHHEVDDALVNYSNKQPFTVGTHFPIKPEPLLLVLVIISGIVSDSVGCLCKFRTLLTSKFPLIVVSLYNVIFLVVDNPMYEKPLTFKHILANDISVLKSIIYAFAVNCVSAKAFESPSLIIIISAPLNTSASKLPEITVLPDVLTF